MFPASLSGILTYLAMLVDGPHFLETDDSSMGQQPFPAEHEIIELEEESGTLRQNHYLRVPFDHPDLHRWHMEIGGSQSTLLCSS